MKSRPIIMSTDSVIAIKSGQKTMTRRIVAPQPPEGYTWRGVVEYAMRKRHQWDESESSRVHRIRCPYGQPGDRLWVKEAWGLCHRHDPTDWLQGSIVADAEAIAERGYVVEYRAEWWPPASGTKTSWRKWRPARYMPRWASRMELEVVNVRAERVQDITEEDAKAEGVANPLAKFTCLSPQQPILSTRCQKTFGSHPYTGGFAVLWDEINGERAPWSENPWAWVVEFAVAKREGGA